MSASFILVSQKNLLPQNVATAISVNGFKKGLNKLMETKPSSLISSVMTTLYNL